MNPPSVLRLFFLCNCPNATARKLSSGMFFRLLHSAIILSVEISEEIFQFELTFEMKLAITSLMKQKTTIAEKKKLSEGISEHKNEMHRSSANPSESFDGCDATCIFLRTSFS